MKKAVFAGSFDPITLGHIDILEQALKQFDEVVVVLGINPDKKGMFSYRDRLTMIEGAIKKYPNVSCAFNDGITVDYAKRIGASYLVRGLRDEIDREYEIAMAEFNRSLEPSIETIFFSPSVEVGDISSSTVRHYLNEGKDISSLVPLSVLEFLKK
ncbi:MAG: pantetheine-phosphate adenylyltransferase [Bacilli bacterium]|nr:pantetheine-phosphate adenylyltransferase [Bacilli bacterium]